MRPVSVCVCLCARVQRLCIVYDIRGNSVGIMQGGAIYAQGGTVTIDHSLFQHNEAVSSASASELLDFVCVHGVRARVTVLMRWCGCLRAWVRVCLGLASRTAQPVGRLDAPCVYVCTCVQCLRAGDGADACVWLLACVGARVPWTGVPDGAESRSP
eukprot:SAG25_NODE_187_length_12399_cov_42.588537_12_plen_157_part_00